MQNAVTFSEAVSQEEHLSECFRFGRWLQISGRSVAHSLVSEASLQLPVDCTQTISNKTRNFESAWTPFKLYQDSVIFSIAFCVNSLVNYQRLWM